MRILRRLRFQMVPHNVRLRLVVIFVLALTAAFSAINASAQDKTKSDPKSSAKANAKAGDNSKAAQSGKEKLSGLTKEDYEKTFLGEDDLPGMKLGQNSKGMGPDKGDDAYAKLGGKFTGLAIWNPAKEGTEVNHMSRIVDLRWVFPDAASAQAYEKDQLKAMAEGMEPVKNAPKVGDDCYVFGGVLNLGLGDPLRNYIFVFRKNNVLVKFYACEFDAKGDLRPLAMVPMCQKIVDRIKAVEKDQ
jgi:hypothetical protein